MIPFTTAVKRFSIGIALHQIKRRCFRFTTNLAQVFVDQVQGLQYRQEKLQSTGFLDIICTRNCSAERVFERWTFWVIFWWKGAFSSSNSKSSSVGPFRRAFLIKFNGICLIFMRLKRSVSASRNAFLSLCQSFLLFLVDNSLGNDSGLLGLSCTCHLLHKARTVGFAGTVGPGTVNPVVELLLLRRKPCVASRISHGRHLSCCNVTKL